MNRLFLTVCLVFILVTPQAWATMTQYPNPYRQTMWNNFTDGIHTLGQSPYEAKMTKRKLHQARTRARLHSINLARQKAMLST
jgi:hypothetical protein